MLALLFLQAGGVSMRTIAIIGVAAIAGGLSLALSVPPARSQSPIPQPSFDCSRVTTQIERAICADPELAQWDGRMGQAFKRKYSQLGGEQRRALLTDQRQWIALRNGQCDVATFYLTAEQCILQLTKTRIATLEGWKAVAAGSANTPNAQGPVSVSKIAQAETSSPKVSFLKGECKVELDAADLGCDGSAFHTKLDNGQNLVSFPTRDVAIIGFAGNAAVRTVRIAVCFGLIVFMSTRTSRMQTGNVLWNMATTKSQRSWNAES